MLQRFPGNLEQQTLLRVHLGSLAKRDVEEFRIKGVDIGQERSPTRCPRQRRGHRRRAVVVRRPPIRWHLFDRGPAVAQELPQRLRTRDYTWQSASQTD